ncbi:hypothetical protein ACIRVK_04450 [Streptomyces sp. NPDC101152]|uniref:hypothetical protein n=1 Tax=Streptomyces sp. NPDC101152 TaxID=3366116 RepID=UPI00381F360D
MLRHEFQPGRLVAGLFLALAGAMYAGDAGGLWDTPWFAVIPVVAVGLFLAAAVGLVSRGIRRRRAVTARRQESAEAEPDASA